MSARFAPRPSDVAADRVEIARLREALEAMTEERDYWRAEAGAQADADLRDRLRIAFALRPSGAAILAALHARRGRTLSRDEIDAVLPPRDHAAERTTNVVEVQITHLRQRIGARTVVNLRCRGYYLTPEGIAACDAAMGNAPPRPSIVVAP